MHLRTSKFMNLVMLVFVAQPKACASNYTPLRATAVAPLRRRFLPARSDSADCLAHMLAHTRSRAGPVLPRSAAVEVRVRDVQGAACGGATLQHCGLATSIGAPAGTGTCCEGIRPEDVQCIRHGMSIKSMWYGPQHASTQKQAQSQARAQPHASPRRTKLHQNPCRKTTEDPDNSGEQRNPSISVLTGSVAGRYRVRPRRKETKCPTWYVESPLVDRDAVHVANNNRDTLLTPRQSSTKKALHVRRRQSLVENVGAHDVECNTVVATATKNSNPPSRYHVHVKSDEKPHEFRRQSESAIPPANPCW